MTRNITPALALLSTLLLLLPALALTGPTDSSREDSGLGATATADPATYYLNKNRQSSGDHEVHREDCRYVPAPKNRLELGEFTDCREAVREAKRRGYPTADGCSFCAPACDHG